METEDTFADIMIVIYRHKQASTVITGPRSLEVVEAFKGSPKAYYALR